MPSPEEEARGDKLTDGEGAESQTALPGAAPSSAEAPNSPRGSRARTVLQKAVATGTESAKAADAKVAEANHLYQAAQYDQANAALDQAEALLKAALTSAAKQPTATTTALPAEAARFTAHLKALAPVLQKADATGTEPAKAAHTQVAEANKLYVAKTINKPMPLWTWRKR